MNKKIFSLVAIGLLALLTSAIAYAQMPGTALRVTIPFDFTVNGKTLPAGNYLIRRVTDSPEVLMIASASTHDHAHAIFETGPVVAKKIPNKAEIVFHQYGNTYFLSEVFTGGEQTGRELATSRQERALRSDVASNGTKAETVALVANQ